MTKKIKGAEKGESKKVSPFEERIEVFGNNLANLAQMVVNQHYTISRMQMIMDALIVSNEKNIEMPSEEIFKNIEARAVADTRNAFPSFFVDKDVDIKS